MAKSKPAPMMHMVPLQGAHFRQVKMTEHEAPFTASFTLEQLKQMEGPYSTTVFLDDMPILVMGAHRLWENRAYFWFFYSADATAQVFGEMLSIVRTFLDGLPFQRVETAVEYDYAIEGPGGQFVRSLGFELETSKPMRAFFENGRAGALYSRIKEV